MLKYSAKPSSTFKNSSSLSTGTGDLKFSLVVIASAVKKIVLSTDPNFNDEVKEIDNS